MAWNRKGGRLGQEVRERFLSAKKPYVSYTRRITRVKTSQRMVTIAFDDGPTDLPASPDKFSGRSLTDILLDVLGEYEALGTFCMVGDTGENYPDAAGKVGRPHWNGLRYDHYPDINQDERGGVANNPEIVRRLLSEGHQAVNHSYRHIPFGRRPFPPWQAGLPGKFQPGNGRPHPPASGAGGEASLYDDHGTPALVYGPYQRRVHQLGCL